MLNPTALLHGVNDFCPRDDWTTFIRYYIGDRGKVKCIEVGDGWSTSYRMDMFYQGYLVCQKLLNDPDFAGREVNIVGLSQAGVAARAVVERCPGLRVHTIYSVGGP